MSIKQLRDVHLTMKNYVILLSQSLSVAAFLFATQAERFQFFYKLRLRDFSFSTNKRQGTWGSFLPGAWVPAGICLVPNILSPIE